MVENLGSQIELVREQVCGMWDVGCGVCVCRMGCETDLKSATDGVSELSSMSSDTSRYVFLLDVCVVGLCASGAPESLIGGAWLFL